MGYEVHYTGKSFGKKVKHVVKNIDTKEKAEEVKESVEYQGFKPAKIVKVD